MHMVYRKRERADRRLEWRILSMRRCWRVPFGGFSCRLALIAVVPPAEASWAARTDGAESKRIKQDKWDMRESRRQKVRMNRPRGEVWAEGALRGCRADIPLLAVFPPTEAGLSSETEEESDHTKTKPIYTYMNICIYIYIDTAMSSTIEIYIYICVWIYIYIVSASVCLPCP